MQTSTPLGWLYLASIYKVLLPVFVFLISVLDIKSYLILKKYLILQHTFG